MNTCVSTTQLWQIATFFHNEIIHIQIILCCFRKWNQIDAVKFTCLLLYYIPFISSLPLSPKGHSFDFGIHHFHNIFTTYMCIHKAYRHLIDFHVIKLWICTHTLAFLTQHHYFLRFEHIIKYNLTHSFHLLCHIPFDDFSTLYLPFLLLMEI